MKGVRDSAGALKEEFRGNPDAREEARTIYEVDIAFNTSHRLVSQCGNALVNEYRLYEDECYAWLGSVFF